MLKLPVQRNYVLYRKIKLLEVAIIFIGFAFLISMFLNIKHITSLTNAKLIYTLISISFVSGSSVLYFEIQLTKSEVARTTEQLANIHLQTTKLTPANKVVGNTNKSKPTLSPTKPRLSQTTPNTHLTPEGSRPISGAQKRLHLYPGRTATFNVPIGKAVNVVNVSCDIALIYQNDNFLVRRGEGIVLDRAELKIEQLKLNVVESRPVDTDMPRGSPNQMMNTERRSSNKPFSSNGLSANQQSVVYGRPNCTVAISLI